MELAAEGRARRTIAASRARRVPSLHALVCAAVLLLSDFCLATTDGPGTGSPARANERAAPQGVSVTGALIAEHGGPVGVPLLVRARYARAVDGAGNTIVERRAAPDPAGRFHVVLPSGQADLRIEVRGFVPAERGSVDLVPGSVLDLETVRCVAGETLKGRVLDTAGSPIAGARVTALDRGRRSEATSDAEGRFAIPGLPAGRTVDVGADREGYSRGPLVVAHPGVRELELTLAARASLAMRVLLGIPPRPARTVTLELTRLEGSGELRLGGVPLTKTAEADDGRIAIEGLDPGRWSVRVRAAGAEPVSLDDVVLAPGERVDAGDVHASEGARVAGRVLDARDGRPLRGVRVGVESQGLLERTDPAFTVDTDELGRFTLDGLPSRPLRIVALEAHHVERVLDVEPLAGVPAEVVLELGARGAVDGIAHDTAGVPRTGWTVVLTGSRLAAGPRTAVTDDAGAFRIDDLDPGTYRALLLPPQDEPIAPGTSLATHAVTVRANETSVLAFGPAPAAVRVRGLVRRAGRAVSAMLLWAPAGAIAGAGDVIAASTADDGAFDVELPAAGAWDVVLASGNDGEPVSRRVTVEASPLLIDIEEAAVSGTVVDAQDGRPLSGATVVLAARDESPAVAAPSVTTDALGRFRLAAARGAVTDVVVRRAGYGTLRRSRVRPGEGFGVRCALAPEVALRVRVVDAAGRPVVGAAVMLLGDGASTAPAVFTAQDGVARVPGAARGEVVVGAIARTLAPAVLRLDTSFETTPTLVLSEPAGPLGIVALGDGKAPCVARAVSVLTSGVDLGPLLRARALYTGDEPVTDGRGHLDPGPLALGNYTIRLAGDGGPSIDVQLGPAARDVELKP